MNQLLLNRKRESSGAPTVGRSLKLKNTKLVLCTLLACTILILCGCGKTPAKPVAIGSNDACFYCKSPISDLAFAAEFVTSTGFVRKFDDISCLVANARKVGKKNIVAFYAIDAQSKAFFPADQMQFVRSDKIRTPRNGRIVALQDPTQAKAVAARYQGEIVKFDDLLK
jgi:nitrous oxide reductase accessory protein NosL